jgi:tripartite-type tricarboxylate transporter receptor subunit TctC
MKSSLYRKGIAIMTVILSLMGAEIVGAEFPEKPIQVLVGWPVGSSNDAMDRAIAQSLQKILKQPVIVQNVPGAGGSLVLGRVKTEKPDGYALFQTGSNMFSQAPHLRSAPFDSLKDFAYLSSHARFQQLLEDRPDSPWRNYEELIQYVKQNPKKVRYSSTGVGGGNHMVMEYLALRENLQWIHVPYNGAVEAYTALLGGHVELASVSFGMELEHIQTGRIRPLLCLNHNRMSRFPDLPTVVDKGHDFAIVSAASWAVPVDTPKDIQRILEKALLQSFKDPAVIDVINKWNLVYEPLDGEAVTKMITKDYKLFGDLAQKLGLGIYKK